ncbi:MAG: endonuclease III [Eubacteriales bacterium]|nr:endonuclease III [Eubacteriales bacterium]
MNNNSNNITADVVKAFYREYPRLECALEYGGDPFRLLIMAILSAQCTDRQVNAVSEALFKRFPDAASIAESEPGELERYIYSTGFYNTKAKSIRACCKTLTDEFGGAVPSEMSDLLKLGGVGRKVANLIRGDIFGLGGIVADTHMIRISNRLGLVSSRNPVIVEKTLSNLVPIELQSGFCHRAVVFGREICKAKKPKCDKCFIKAKGLCGGV